MDDCARDQSVARNCSTRLRRRWQAAGVVILRPSRGRQAIPGASEWRVFHVVLHEPEIPANTGNLVRLCANAGCRLHLIEPLGFRLDRRSVRRAALDYEELTILQTHVSLAACRQRIEQVAMAQPSHTPAATSPPRWFAIETEGVRAYSEAAFRPGDVLLFGSETRGLPREILQEVPQMQRLHVPMQPGNRSLNLSNCVALVVYEAWRQNGFGGAAATRSG